MNEYFRHMAFAEAVATLSNSIDPSVIVLVQGFDVSIAEICKDVQNDPVMPDDITTALTLVPPATYAVGASSLRKRMSLVEGVVFQ
jgi:hypothetical protein